MARIAAVILVAAMQPAPAPAPHQATITDCRPVWQRESDAFRRTAHKALAGQFGTLAPWQARGYKAGLAKGSTCSRAITLTAYYGTEASGRIDAHGTRCSTRTCASNRLPQYSYVWTTRSGLRQVLDTGSRRNDLKASGLGGTWVDVWYRDKQSARRAGIDGWVPVIGAAFGGRY